MTHPSLGTETVVKEPTLNVSTYSQSQFSEPLNQSIESNFNYDGRQHCSQMTSCDEAKYFINNCPNTNIDGDHDGIPHGKIIIN
jgi:Excalibur calcium-binding domain.